MDIECLTCGNRVDANQFSRCSETGKDFRLPQTNETISFLRTEGGGIFGVDGSFLEQEAGPIYDPFDGKEIILTNDEEMLVYCV